MDPTTKTYLSALEHLTEHLKGCTACTDQVPADYCTEGWYLYTAVPASRRPSAGAGRPLKPAAELDSTA